MKLLELLARAELALPGANTYRRAIAVVIRKWPHVNRFTDEQLLELCGELEK